MQEGTSNIRFITPLEINIKANLMPFKPYYSAVIIFSCKYFKFTEDKVVFELLFPWLIVFPCLEMTTVDWLLLWWLMVDFDILLLLNFEGDEVSNFDTTEEPYFFWNSLLLFLG